MAEDTSAQPAFQTGQPKPPGEVYAQRIAELKVREAALQTEHIRLGWLRLAFGVAIAILLFPPVPFALLPFGAFIFAARVHGAVLARLAATRRSLAMYAHAQARLEDRWAGLQPRSTRINASASLYAADLDLFGPASVFELLCAARTTLGEDTLAQWLLAPADLTEVMERQAAVRDLRGRVSLRQAFAAAPGPALASLDRTALATWAERAASDAPPPWWQWVAPVLVLLTLAAVGLSFRLHSLVPVIVAVMVNSTLTFTYRRGFSALFGDTQGAAKSLRNAASLFKAIEAEACTAPRLLHLQEQLQRDAPSAAQAVSRLATLSAWIDARGSYLIRLLDPFLLYSLQLAVAVQRWKERHAASLGTWLDALGTWEALQSLAGYSYEHPQDAFPQLTKAPAHFHAEGLGHPLLSAAACVRNDVALGGIAGQVLLVSGSNMSGKSTLLRSVGVNAVLAFTGAPVRARSLSLSQLTVAASIHVNDSLQAGRSRFYAEILRLRDLTQAARLRPPVLFLVDELLAGTNSSDRLAGAQGLLRELLREGAIGMLSTHDLALTALASLAPQQIVNVHFEDTVENEQLRFDYKLRDGVVERSNGLALMRMIGLDV